MIKKHLIIPPFGFGARGDIGAAGAAGLDAHLDKRNNGLTFTLTIKELPSA
jgi:hypothetical protein